MPWSNPRRSTPVAHCDICCLVLSVFTVTPAAPVTPAHRSCLLAFLGGEDTGRRCGSQPDRCHAELVYLSAACGAGSFTRNRDLPGVLTQMCQPHLFCVKWYQTLTVMEESCLQAEVTRAILSAVVWRSHWKGSHIKQIYYLKILVLGMNPLLCSYCWRYVFMTLRRQTSTPVGHFASDLKRVFCLRLVVLKGLNRGFVTAPHFQLFITQLCAHCWLHWSILQYSRISSGGTPRPDNRRRTVKPLASSGSSRNYTERKERVRHLHCLLLPT